MKYLHGCEVNKIGAIALSYPPTVRVRAMVKLSTAFFNDESSITIGGGVRKCNSAIKSIYAIDWSFFKKKI